MMAVRSRTWVATAVAGALAIATIYAAAMLHAGFAPATGTPAMHVNLLFPASGFVVGMLVGLTGVGGGSLMTPLLVLLFGFHPGTAVGTDLLYASGTKAVGTAVHGAKGTVDWRICGWLALGSIPATLASLAVLAMLGINGDKASKLISLVLGIALILTAICLVFRKPLLDFASRRLPEPSRLFTVLATIALGAALGVLITVSSVGAGAIGMTVLLFLYPRHPLARLVGTDIAHAVPLTLLAGIGHLLLGSVKFALLFLLLIGSIPGIVIGSHLSSRLPEGVLRPILAVILAIVGYRLLL